MWHLSFVDLQRKFDSMIDFKYLVMISQAYHLSVDLVPNIYSFYDIDAMPLFISTTHASFAPVLYHRRLEQLMFFNVFKTVTVRDRSKYFHLLRFFFELII